MSQSNQPEMHRFTDGLSHGTPSASGVASDRVMAFLDDVEADGLEMQSMAIWRAGKVVCEGFRWPYAPSDCRLAHSMTKAVVSCAYGLMLAEGRLSLTDRVASFFPEMMIDPDAPVARMTVEDLLTMRAGHGAETSGSIWRSIESSWIEEFFKIPVEHEPGSVHVYSSASSYMLSAIASRVIGETLYDYLKPRLFDPLGITDLVWDISPDGINPGGNGIRMPVSDGLKLGILHAQRGVWEGKQILPAEWIELATRPHGSPEYGYHWVLGEHYFALLGQFVQMVAIFPEFDAVVAVHCAIADSSELKPHLALHFPAVFIDAPSTEADVQLQARLAAWDKCADLSPDAQDSELSGHWTLDENIAGIADLIIETSSDRVIVEYRDNDTVRRIDAPVGSWTRTTTSLGAPTLHHGYDLVDTPTVIGAQWVDPAHLQIVAHFTETAFRDTFDLKLRDDRLTLERSVNMNSAARAWPVLEARRA